LVLPLGNLVTVTAKIPADLRDRLRELGVNISQLIRRALEAEIERREKERLKREAEEAAKILRKIPPDELVESVRAGRESL